MRHENISRARETAPAALVRMLSGATTGKTLVQL
jgi:hypothetical protein